MIIKIATEDIYLPGYDAPRRNHKYWFECSNAERRNKN